MINDITNSCLENLKLCLKNGTKTHRYPEKLAGFYALLGLVFDYHKHGGSPYHYSATIGHTILEIYPLAKGQTEVDKHLRLGFGIEDFDKTVTLLKETRIVFSTEPTQTDFGYMAVIVDPDGRKIELYKK